MRERKTRELSLCVVDAPVKDLKLGRSNITAFRQQKVIRQGGSEAAPLGCKDKRAVKEEKTKIPREGETPSCPSRWILQRRTG